MKKSISILLLCMLLLASCGTTENDNPSNVSNDTQTTTETETELETKKSRLDELGAKDFGGNTFTIMDANDYPDRSLNVDSGELNGEAINDAIHVRNEKISDLYNLNITYVQSGSQGAGDFCNQILQGQLAGDKLCDLVYSTAAAGNTLMYLAQQNTLANLNDTDYFSFDQPWWSGFVYENLTLAGKTYFMTGDITPTMYMTPMVIYGNLNLIENYTPGTDIYSMVINGQWTFDKLIEYKELDEDVNGDNVMNTSDDFFGFCANTDQNTLTSNAFVVAGGVDLCANTGDTITINLDNDQAVAVVEKLSQIMIKAKDESYGDWIMKAFPGDKIIFAQAGMTNATDLREMESDFIILPLPKYDEAQKDYKCLMNAWEAAFTAIPANADIDMSSFIAEALCYESYVSVRPQVYDRFLKQKLVRDERSTQMIDLIFGTLTLDFNSLVNFGGTTDALANAVYKGHPLISSITEKKSKADETITKFVTAWNEE